VENHLVAVHGALFSHGGCELSRLNTEERRKTSYGALMSHASGARVCAFGNTHQLGIFEMRDGVERVLPGNEVTMRNDSHYLVNPGSVGQPHRRDRRATYLSFDTERRTLTVHRVSYDFALPIAKACKAGLLPFYARFPESMRAPIRWTANTFGLRRSIRKLVTDRQQGRPYPE
jgi:diadenosine tetraphosphatase ApaH/serine/threonine PP2A family protein phosphatase